VEGIAQRRSHDSPPFRSTRKDREGKRAVRLTALALVLVACSFTAEDLTPTASETTVLHAAATDRFATEAIPTAERSPTPAQVPSPTPSRLPPHTYRLEIRSWPDVGALIEPIDIDVIFEATLRDIPAGEYVIFADSRNDQLLYAALDGQPRGILVTGVADEKVGRNGSPTRVIEIFFPRRVHQAEMLTGTTADKVDKLVDRLREAKVC